MASFQENTQEPEQVPGVKKAQALKAMQAVLDNRYNWYLFRPHYPNALTALRVIQDVRKHYRLNVNETEG